MLYAAKIIVLSSFGLSGSLFPQTSVLLQMCFHAIPFIIGGDNASEIHTVVYKVEWCHTADMVTCRMGINI